MQNLAHVECAETPGNLDEDIPNLLLLDVGFPLLVVADLLVQISIVRELHHKAQATAALVNESFFVTDYVWFVDARENPDFVEGIFSFFLS